MFRPMKKALVPILSLTVCLFAAGCTDTDWNHMLNFGGGADEDGVTPAKAAAQSDAPATTAAAGPAAAEPSNAEFCRGVAAQDATRNDFDQATQQKVFARSYQQCVAIYTR